VTPRKARVLANELRGKGLEKANEIMQMVPRKASRMWQKVIDAAVANLEQLKGSEGLDRDLVYVKEIRADGGPTWKRWLPRAQGRAYRVTKRTSHLTVTVAER
jgi:large subunit ribosomal protein L22